jgi:hypothetical protein
MKPGVIVLSKDSDPSFEWLSDGWYSAEERGRPEAEALMARAHAAIDAAKDVPEACRLLEAAGFRVVRSS